MSRPQHRVETRKERIEEKLKTAKKYPISLCSVNFAVEENIAYLFRAAACFGAEAVHVIGSLPEYKHLRRKSGSTFDYIETHTYSRPDDFIHHCREKGIRIVSIELDDDAVSLDDYEFTPNERICIVVGNENTGTPEVILKNSQTVYIPMDGLGHCLNTSVACSVALAEYTRQMRIHGRS